MKSAEQTLMEIVSELRSENEQLRATLKHIRNGGMAGKHLTATDIDAIKASDAGTRTLAKHYNVDRSVIQKIRNGYVKGQSAKGRI